MKTILIVDDEFGIVDALTDLLVEEGHHVVCASNGKTGLDQLKSCAPDLILLDMMMPVLSGRGMLEAMRAHPDHAHIPVIIMSAIPESVAFPKGEPKPMFTAYLRKPFSLVALLATVEDCLSQSEG